MSSSDTDKFVGEPSTKDSGGSNNVAYVGASKSGEDDGEVRFLTGGAGASRKDKNSTWHRLTRARPIVYLLIILFLILLLLILIIALGVRSSSCISDVDNSMKSLYKGRKTKSGPYLSTDGTVFPYQEIRLPTSVVPILYDLYLHPNVTVPSPHYSGNVSILCICRSKTNKVVVHTKNLTIIGRDVQVLDELGRRIGGGDDVKESIGLEQLYIPLSERSCRVNEKIRVNIPFQGLLQKTLVGFYLSEYNKNGKKISLGTTHMEPTAARRAFPCFDEPEFKANFSLKMLRDRDHYSLFNMPKKGEKYISANLRVDEYQYSVKMSTYLVAFMILPNDYKALNGTTTTGVKVGVYAPSEMISSAKFALNVALRVLPFFENFFGIAYPLPKLDMVCVADFSAGAMENWGLIIYRYMAMLHDPRQASVEHQQSVAEIISHELAHQWFGNIVTMKWWNDLWLNEGFATYVQHIGADFFNSTWKVMDQFQLQNFQYAFFFDAHFHSHPVSVSVTDPHEIDSIFDDVVYFKGSSLIRMLGSVIGRNVTKIGLNKYLNKFQYRNAASFDLWNALSAAYNANTTGTAKHSPARDLKRVMSTWTEQSNYPLVAVSIAGRRINFEQFRYLLYPNATGVWHDAFQSKYKYRWSIPIRFVTDREPRDVRTFWLDMKEKDYIDLNYEPKWIKANYKQVGYYRVNYTEKIWKALTKQLRDNLETISPDDRGGLLSDAFNLARAGRLDIRVALDLSMYLINETQQNPWSTAYKCLSYVFRRLKSAPEILPKFRKYINHITSKALHGKGTRFTLTNQNLDHLGLLTRLPLLQLGILGQDKEIIKQAYEIYQDWKAGRKTVDPNIKLIVYFAGVIKGDRENWEYLWNRVNNGTGMSVSEKRIIRRVLASTRDSALLLRMLRSTLDNEKVRAQDALSIIEDVAKSPVGQDLVWLFIRRNWAKLRAMYADHAFLMSEFVRTAKELDTELDFQVAKAFFAEHELGSGERAGYQVLEQIRSNAEWRRININKIEQWLNQRFNT